MLISHLKFSRKTFKPGGRLPQSFCPHNSPGEKLRTPPKFSFENLERMPTPKELIPMYPKASNH